MKELDTEYFTIKYQKKKKKLVQDSLNIFDNKFGIIESLFGKNLKEYGKMKCAFFTERKDFIDYIKSISNGHTPPSWATGCFYNGEIQIFVGKNDMKSQVILTHEFTHLCIKNTIYDPYNIERVRWFDESYARFIDGHLDNVDISTYAAMIAKIKELGRELDVNNLDDINNVITEKIDGYIIFDVIGKYIFENSFQRDYLDILKTDVNKIREIGKSILGKAVDWFEKNK